MILTEMVESDIIGGGDRSWLYLDYDVNNIKKIILGTKLKYRSQFINGFPGNRVQMQPHLGL